MSDDDSDKKSDSENGDSDNIIRIPTLAERDRMRKQQNAGSRGTNGSGGYEDKQPFFGAALRSPGGDGDARQPFFNIPPMTKCVTFTLVGLHVALTLVLPHFFPGLVNWLVYHMAFIPGRFTGELPFLASTLFTPVTYMLLHGGWLHLFLNVFMLLAFGAGIEKWFGGRKLLLMLVLCGIFGVVLHFMFFPKDVVPVIGASGGISGLFAVILVMINKGRWRAGPGGAGILPFAILWVVISIASGFIGGLGHNSIAWAVHLGGFFGGFVLMRPYFKKQD